jgi:hypothetical protein
MPFAPFIAINRHAQSIQVGCAFLRNESADSYVWLFRAFLEAMNGLEPLNLITDQDLSMVATIRAVFISTRHRCCRWHIISKIESRLGVYFSSKGEDYNEIVNHSLSPEEFESRWQGMIEKHGAAENEILCSLYQIKMKSFAACIRLGICGFQPISWTGSIHSCSRPSEARASTVSSRSM